MAPIPADRAAYYRWLFFAAGPLEAAVINHALGFEVPEDKRAVAGYGSYAAAIDALAKSLPKSGYIAGAQFSAADVYVGSHVGWGLEFDTIEKRPIFEDYAARARDREAYRRAKALDDAAMPKEDSA